MKTLIGHNKFCIIILASCFQACIDTIELDVPAGGVSEIAVDGKLIYGKPSTIEISITEVFDFDGFPNQISVKYVELLDESGNSSQIRFQNNGVYTKQYFNDDPDITITPGNRYKIRILLASDEMIESDFQALKRVPQNNRIKQESVTKIIEQDDGQIIDSPAIRFIAENTVPADKETKLKLEVRRTYRLSNLNSGTVPFNERFCNLEAPGKGFAICDLLREDPSNPGGLFDCDKRGFMGVSNAVECDTGKSPRDSTDEDSPTIISRSCYISGYEDFTNLKLFDPEKDQSGNVSFTQDLFEASLDFKFAEGFYAQLITETLDKKAYEYFEKIDKINAISGSMFDPPAGKVTGNLTNLTNSDATVYGYFYFTEQDTVGTYIEQDTITQGLFCLNDFGGMPPDICEDCTLLAGVGEEVSVLRPSYWPRAN